jgi:hypothetical protein
VPVTAIGARRDLAHAALAVTAGSSERDGHLGIGRARGDDRGGHVEDRVHALVAGDLHDHAAGLTTSPGSAPMAVTTPGASA